MTHHRQVRVTWERTVSPEDAARFYDLYLAAFSPLATLSAVRQILRRDEFDEEMADDRVEKLVARDDHGVAVGMTIMTSTLSAIPWISPEFYAARYPDHAARGAIYYVAFTLAHPTVRGTGAYITMLDTLIERLAAERAVCVYDICAYNNLAINFADHLSKRALRSAEITVEVLDVQTFYGAEFHGVRSGVGAAASPSLVVAERPLAGRR
jgi:hypothetical protein